jgi:hypothetical protein
MYFLFLPALCGKEYYSYPHSAGRNNIPAHRLVCDVARPRETSTGMQILSFSVKFKMKECHRPDNYHKNVQSPSRSCIINCWLLVGKKDVFQNINVFALNCSLPLVQTNVPILFQLFIQAYLNLIVKTIVSKTE